MARHRRKQGPNASRGHTARVSRLADVAAHFGVSLRTVKRWRAGLMPGRPGAWDLGRIAVWRDKQAAEAGPRSHETMAADLEDLLLLDKLTNLPVTE